MNHIPPVIPQTPGQFDAPRPANTSNPAAASLPASGASSSMRNDSNRRNYHPEILAYERGDQNPESIQTQRSGTAPRTPSELLGRPPRSPSRILSRQIQNAPINTVLTNVVGGSVGFVGAVAAGLRTAIDEATLPDPEGARIVLSVYTGLGVFGVASTVAARILSNAALTNRLYALENGPNAPRVIELIGHVAESVPANRQDAVLEHFERNWDSFTEDFFAVRSENAEEARNGARRLAENRSLNRVLNLNDQPFSPETRGDALEILDILAGRSNNSHSPLAVLNSGQYVKAAEAIYQDLPYRHSADFFWIRQTDQGKDMPRLPIEASPEMTIAALMMHSVGIPYGSYAEALPAADTQRKAKDTELNQ